MLYEVSGEMGAVLRNPHSEDDLIAHPKRRAERFTAGRPRIEALLGIEDPKAMPNVTAPRKGATVKVFTSCPCPLQDLTRFADDTGAQPDYIVAEMARHLLGERWLEEFVSKANARGIERVLL